MNKKWIAAIMSCLLAITSPISSLAANSINGGGSGSSQTNSTREYIASMHAYQMNNGIQCSIVRKDNGQLVSNIVTLVNYLPTQIGSAPDGNLRKYWKAYYNRTGIFNMDKQYMLFLSGPMKDTTYTSSYVKIDGSGNAGYGVSYFNNETGRVEQGKMYTYADIEVKLERSLDTFYKNSYPEYAAAYEAAGGSPISVTGGVYQATGVSKKIHGPVDLIDGRNTATGDIFRDQLNTKLPDGTIVLQRLLDLKIPKTDGLGNVVGPEEPLFHFTDPAMKSRYDELVAQKADKALVQVMIENNLYFEVEAVAWQVNEMTNPEAPAGYNATGFSNEQFWNSLYIYFGTPRLVTYQTSLDFVNYVNNWKSYKRAYDDKKNTAAFDAYMTELQKQVGRNFGDNSWVNPLQKWYIKSNANQAWDWGLAYQAFTLDKPEPQIGLQTFADLGIDKTTVDHTILGKLSFWLGHLDDLGYGVMLFSPVPEGSTSTFDEVNYSSSSTNGYRPGPSEDKSKDGGTEAKNNIIKFYATKTGNDYVYTENHTRSNTVGNITLEDEEGYKIDSWYTSSIFKEPTNKNDSYDNWKSSMENKQAGNKTGNVILSQGETLYLRLVEAPVVIKVYETGGTVDKVVTDTNPRFENNTLIVTTPDNGYEYIEGVKSGDKVDVKSWDEVPTGTHVTDKNISLSPNEKVVYLHYHKDGSSNTGLVLHENEISHQFTLSDVKGTLLDGIRKYSSVSVSGSCPEIWYCSDDDCDGHRCGASYEYQNSDDWTYTIENVPSYNTQFVWKWVQTDQKSYSGNGLSESGGEGHSTPDMKMVLQRSISDKGTLYPKLNADESTLKAMGLQGAAYQPVHQRKDGVSDQPSRKSWTETFTTNWTFTAHNTPTAYFATDHGYTDTDEHTNTGNEGELNSAYSQTGNTLVYGLWGKANEGVASPVSDKASNSKWDIEGVLKFTGLKSHFKADAKMQFYPYYRMKYVSELDSSEKDAYLTSENLSILLNIQRVDTAMFKASSGKTLDLTSTQWSIHAGAQKLIKDSADKDSLLPAGAIYTLGSAGGGSKASPIWIGYRIFNTYVPDKAVLADATGIKNRDEVIATINTFKADTERVVDGLEVAMYGTTGLDFSSDDTKFWQNSKQITGKDGQYGIGGQKFISDKKYDLKTGGTGTDSSDINILERKEEQYDWIISSDVDGNITISRNGQELEKLTKSSKTFTNVEVKEFNDRTKLVENFISSIDRNLGSDRSGKSWYNEGFTVGCIEERYAVRVGFGDEDHNKRSAALNIKANGKLENRQDMFSSDPEKNRSYQFFTATRSTVADAGSHQPGWIGTYDGTDIQLPNIHLLLCSKRFYTSNTTVMDLN